MIACPNKNLPEWKALVTAFGEEVAYREYVLNNYNIPSIERILNNPFFNKSMNELRQYILSQSGASNGFISPAAYITATSLVNKLTRYTGRKMFQLVKTQGNGYVLKSLDLKGTNNESYSIIESSNVGNQVQEVFESNPELAEIGTQKQYAEYLNTIFPDSKVKDIVYHGAMEQLLPKDGKFKGYVTYFTDFKNYAETFGFPVNRKILPAVINVKNPFNAQSKLADVPEEVHITDQFTNPRIIKSNTKSYDSVIGIDAGQKEGKTIAVFEPEQIHILGSQQDIEGFKEFVTSKSNPTAATLLNDVLQYFTEWNNLTENQLSLLADNGLKEYNDISKVQSNDFTTLGILQKIRCS